MAAWIIMELSSRLTIDGVVFRKGRRDLLVGLLQGVWRELSLPFRRLFHSCPLLSPSPRNSPVLSETHWGAWTTPCITVTFGENCPFTKISVHLKRVWVAFKQGPAATLEQRNGWGEPWRPTGRLSSQSHSSCQRGVC